MKPSLLMHFTIAGERITVEEPDQARRLWEACRQEIGRQRERLDRYDKLRKAGSVMALVQLGIIAAGIVIAFVQPPTVVVGIWALGVAAGIVLLGRNSRDLQAVDRELQASWVFVISPEPEVPDEKAPPA